MSNPKGPRYDEPREGTKPAHVLAAETHGWTMCSLSWDAPAALAEDRDPVWMGWHPEWPVLFPGLRVVPVDIQPHPERAVMESIPVYMEPEPTKLVCPTCKKKISTHDQRVKMVDLSKCEIRCGGPKYHTLVYNGVQPPEAR